MSEISYISENIRFYRKKRGLTQQELAEKMGVSFQAVSNWETGTTSIDIENFCLLTKVLSVSADALITARSVGKSYMIGIDGGGSKTDFVLFSSDGTVHGRVRIGATNPYTVGYDKSYETLTAGINELLRENDIRLDAIFGGLAGGAQVEKKLCEFLQDMYPNAAVFTGSDAINILAGAGCDIGGICGTGSIVLAREGNENHFLGGWGYFVGDPGSAHSIAHKGIRAVLAYADGFGDDTIIRTLFEEKYETADMEQLRTAIYDSFKSSVSGGASLATVVFSAAKLGDKVALGILDEEMKQFIAEVNCARIKYPVGNRVALAGGVQEHNKELLLPIMKKYALPGTEFVFSNLPPVYGACVECMARANVELCEDFEEKFRKSFARFDA